MSTDSEVTRVVRSWLNTDEYESADRVLGVVLDLIDTTSQRSPSWRAWRKPFMNTTRKLAGAAIVIVLSSVAIALLLRQPAISPATSPPPTATASPAVSPGFLAVEGTIYFGRRGGEYGTGRLFSIAADGSAEESLDEDAACCLTPSSVGSVAIYGTVRSGGWIVPRWRSSDGYTEDFIWSMELEPGYSVSNLSLAPRAATSSGLVQTDNAFAFEGWDHDDGSHAGVYLSVGNGGRRAVGTFSRLTTAPDGFRDVPIAFSADGGRLLYGRYEVSDTEPVSGTGDLFAIRVDGSEPPRQLNPDGVGVPTSDLYGPGASWSPDGVRVTFAGFTGEVEGASKVYVARIDVGTASAIAEGAWITSARWSPSGDQILFDRVAASGVTHDLFAVALDGTGERNLTSTFDGGLCCGNWSPDGSYVVAQGGEADVETNFWIVSVDGLDPVRLTNESTDYLWYSWTP